MTPSRDIGLIGLAVLILVAAILASLAAGIRFIDPFAGILAMTTGEATTLDEILFQASRLPRTVIAVCVGGGLGLAGALLQTVTKNVLADPGLLGINAGAAFAVVVMLAILDAPPPLATMGLVASAGAILTAIMGFVLAGGSRTFETQPLRMVLSGGVLAIALGALTQIVLILQPGAFEASQVWLAGSFADRAPASVGVYALVFVVMCAFGIAMAPALSVLLIGEAQGRSLGVNVARLRITAVAIAAILCGVGVSLAGPIAFVGLIAPHVARAISGNRLGRTFGLSVLFGAVLVLISDIVARLVVAPSELPVGIIIAVAGFPFYILLLRRDVRL
ncbi:MAG: iron ABC transporter permease [Pseudomonadota bacterium]